MTDETRVDLLIIGGGIQGVGVAADAAGRGLSVLLCEKDDLASHTSSASTKLIHGGLRYLEQRKFRLVQEALREREILLRKAPYLVHPLEFVLPHDRHLRSTGIIRIGLWLYDYLAKRQLLKRSRYLKLREVPEGRPLQDRFTKGFAYTDCQLNDDARFVVVNALFAQEKGARILTRTRCVSATRTEEGWAVSLHDNTTRQERLIYATAIVNAAGPWTIHVIQEIAKIESTARVRLVKGSHFIIPKLYDEPYAYILQNFDRRIIFAIPYQKDYTLIGTTDVVFTGNPNQVCISPEEISYLCNCINYYFNAQVSANDIQWSYAGVRTLYDDGTKKPARMTRESYLDLQEHQGKSPIISIFGGKMTTYRRVAERVLNKLMPYFPHMKGDWTAEALLPGAEWKEKTWNEFVVSLKNTYPWISGPLIQRYAENYGTRVHRLLQGARDISDLGTHFGAGLYEKEVRYLLEFEWAETDEDILWRRTKLGLRLSMKEIEKLKEYLSHA